jgi:pyrroline-5-carboxylate reductase
MTSSRVDYGLLGVGALARAIVTGLCEGVAEPPSIVLSPRGAAVSAELAGRHPTVEVAGDNQSVVDRSRLVLVCLRKADAALLAELTWQPEQVVVSAVAGIGVPELERWVAPVTAITRCVPMPPVADRAGLTAVHPPSAAARELFDQLGATLEVADVRAYEALSATSATLAGFFEYLSTQAVWLEEHDIPTKDARRYVAATFAGTLTSLRSKRAPDFAELAAEYATPGGVNDRSLATGASAARSTRCTTRSTSLSDGCRPETWRARPTRPALRSYAASSIGTSSIGTGWR